MTILTGITDQPNQQFSVTLPDGSSVRLTLNFRIQQSGWFAAFLWVKGDGTTWALNGVRLVASPNLLRPYRRLINFGFSVVVDSDLDPVTLRAFSSNAAQIVLLSDEDVHLIEEQVYPGL